MIFTESTIKISNNVSKMDSTIVLYRGDKNVEIRFTILQSPFKYSNTVATNVIESTNASYGQLVIKTPNDKPPIFSEVSATKEGTVLFTITKEMIDEIEELGVYTFQIRLMDENKQSRVTIPPVENGIEIKEPIAIEDDNTTNVVGLAKANYAVATLSDVDTPAFDDNGKYIKTNWNDGDIITNVSLNKIEDGIYTTNENVTATKKYVDDNKIGYIKSETVGETIDTSTMINSFNNNSYIYESNNVTYLEIGKEYHVIVNGVRYRALCINDMPGNDTIYETIIVTGNGFLISITNKMGYNTKYYPDNTKCAYEINLSNELLAAPPTIQILKMDIEYIPTYLMPKDLEILNSISFNRIGDIGIGSAAIGYKNTASNDFTFAMGIQTTASAPGAHAEGGLTIAKASYSHAEGFKSGSTGEYSHVEGIVCESSGQGSHAEGYYTVSSGQRSHSEGCFTEAASQYQHVQGKYNVVDSKGVYAHIVGNGAGDAKRSNAYTLDWQGNAWYSGKVTTGAAPVEDMDLTTKKYVDDNRDYYFKVPTILYDDPNLPKGYVDISTLETGTNYRVNSSIVSGLFKVSLKALNDDGTWFTVDDGSNTIGWSSMLSTSICVELKSDTFIGINMSSINNYCKYLSITKENGKWKLMQTKLNSISPDNMYEYDVVNEYNPATKKYVDDKVSNLPQLSFNEAGELVVTINGVSKTFVPKNV